MKQLIVLFTLCMSMFANAGQLKLSTGGEAGNYYPLGLDIKDFCEPELSESRLEILLSTGGSENLLGMTSKKHNVGIVSEDVLRYYAKQNPKAINKSSIKVLADLHTEPMNVLIPVGWKPTSKGGMFSKFTGMFSKDKAIDLRSLENQTVAAWGGSMVAGEALSQFFDLKLNVQRIESGDMPKAPIIYVTGYPSSVVQSYLDSGKYYLTSVDYRAVKAKVDFYTEETLNYSVNGKPMTVDTIGVRALLVGKSSRRATRNLGMQELSTCILDMLPDLADDFETSPLWEEIYESNEAGIRTDWAYFDLIEK